MIGFFLGPILLDVIEKKKEIKNKSTLNIDR